MTAQLSAITVCGFRSYGGEPQTLLVGSQLTIVGATNSQGKTGLAEAVEFLLTGRIARREMTASAQDEFADALRNAHLANGHVVYVEAKIVDAAAKSCVVRRELLSDYGRREDCKSALTIDGVPADQEALSQLGFVLSQPPLEAPVLAQHTLGYLFSARPQERSNYFKALLEVTDLDTFRASAAGLEAAVPDQSTELLQKWDKCRESEPFKTAFAKAVTPKLAEVAVLFSSTAAGLLKESGIEPPEEATARLSALRALLEEKRAKAFPIAGFRRAPAEPLRVSVEGVWVALALYFEERAKIEAETLRLVELFQAALKIPNLADLASSVDCPLCEAPQALTPQRIAFIKAQLATSASYVQAERKAREALLELGKLAEAAALYSGAVAPQVARWSRQERVAQGFRIARMRAVLGAPGDELIKAWLRAYRQLVRSCRSLAGVSTVLAEEVTSTHRELSRLNNIARLEQLAKDLSNIAAAVDSALVAYAAPAKQLGEALTSVLDANAATGGWQEFLDLAEEQASLRADLVGRQARLNVRRELAAALRQIDTAKDKVLDDKFGELSTAVVEWWNLLRPEEMTYFSAVRSRPGAKRTIDLKAGLATDETRSGAKLRDAIAVFSQSQIHCLGLALFLARAEHEGSAFIVLDDPILTSDEDHRLQFCTGVVDALISKGIQLIVLTQDETTRRDLASRYIHLSPSVYQLVLDEPQQGTILDSANDDLASMLAHAETLSHSNHSASRKAAGDKLRDAAERFCKEVLVREERKQGRSAAITDYAGKVLGALIPMTEPLLSKDASHTGRLRQMPTTLNPANHDANVPSRAAVRQVLGDLKALKKDYLS